MTGTMRGGTGRGCADLLNPPLQRMAVEGGVSGARCSAPSDTISRRALTQGDGQTLLGFVLPRWVVTGTMRGGTGRGCAELC